MAKRRRQPERLRHLALHQSAHAVTATMFGVQYKWVDLKRSGKCLADEFASGWEYGVGPADGFEKEIDKTIRAMVAGHVADEKWNGGMVATALMLPRLPPDFALALDVASLLPARVADVTKFFQERVGDMRELSADGDYWADVSQVADGLMERGRIGHAEVAAIVKGIDLDLLAAPIAFPTDAI